MLTELLLALNFWFDLFLIGIITLPITVLIFNKFYDRGYPFAKILGLLFLCYPIWLLSSLKIVPIKKEFIFLVFVLLAAINWLIFLRFKLFPTLKHLLNTFIFEETIFLATFIAWTFIKGFEPSLHNLEKFMDFGFLNSILRADFMPPKDMWLSNEVINYYYFGHFMTAVLTKFSGINSAISYNLMLSSLFGLCFVGAFSIGSNLYYLIKEYLDPKKTLISGFLAAFLVTLTGNMQTIYAFFQNYSSDKPIPFWTLKPMVNFLGYWYPNATRFIPFTIHEFPIYSFVVSDLHGHVLSIPFVLLMIALLIQTFFQFKISVVSLIFYGFILSILVMTNVLDGPIYLLASAVIFLIHALKTWSFKKAFLETAGNILIISFFMALFSLPFWLSFEPFTSGLGFICSPEFLAGKKIGPLLFEANHCDRSPLWMLTLIYGFFYIVLAGFLITNLKRIVKNEYLVLAFCAVATVLILIPEQFYIKDIYPTHYRANTVFKFGYQAFVIFSIMCGYMIVNIFSRLRKSITFTLIAIPISISFFLVSIYPIFAINSYYNGLNDYHGLNGLKYLSKSYISDYLTILWIKDNIKDQPVLLEAHGDSYSDYGRISANTGLPTVIGWPVHEWLWRGSYDEISKRAAEVKSIYEDKDIPLTEQLLKKYAVKYVYIGILERQKYPLLTEDKFKTLGKVIYQNDQSTIYRLN